MKKPRKPKPSSAELKVKKSFAPSEVTTKKTRLDARTTELRVTRHPKSNKIPTSLSFTFEDDLESPPRRITVGDVMAGTDLPTRAAEIERVKRETAESENLMQVPVIPHLQYHPPYKSEPVPTPTPKPKVPKDRWEKIKLKVFPAWVKRAWPVVYKDVS